MRSLVERRTEILGRQLQCELITSHVDDPGGISYTGYGIAIVAENQDVVLQYSDISTDQQRVKRFIELCVEGEVRLVHIRDLIDDYFLQ